MRLLTQFTVTEADYPRFDGQLMHPVCSTYRLGQALEWAGRLLYLANRPAGTDALGTALSIDHLSPAFPGEVVEVWGQVAEWSDKGKLTCHVEAKVGKRIICKGHTSQRVLPEERIKALLKY